LTTAEVNDVEAYLTLKWRNKKVTLSAAVDATARVSYPDLNCGDGAVFTVDSSALEVGGEAAVTVYGFCERIGGGRIVITDVARRTRPGLVLFRCAGSYAISLDSFEFAGFPKGTTFAWENNELKVVDCPPAGLRVFVR
jgi:hypothetical protein